MITKMIKQDPFQTPSLTQLYNFIRKKNKIYEPKANANPTLELELERIKLTDKYYKGRTKKFIRPCCKTQ